MEEIDLIEIFDSLWKRKLDIIMIVISFLILGYVYTLEFVTPIYTSSITMVLVSSNKDEESNSTITTSDITLNSKLVSTYNKLVKSKNVLKEVISDLDISMSEENLRKDISVESLKNTELIRISVKNENNELAAKIANRIAIVFKEKVKEMYNIDNIEFMGEANIPKIPSNANHKKDIMIFGIVGLIFSVTYMFIVNMIDTTIKGTDMIEKEYELPVLASIPKVR